MRKSFKIVLVLLISLLFSSYVFAGTPVAKGDATMKLVEDNVCDIKFGEYGTFQKKMTNIWKRSRCLMGIPKLRSQ